MERVPDPSKLVSPFFSYHYFPNVTGKIAALPGAAAQNLTYKLATYNAGVSLGAPNTPLFLTAGFNGDRYYRKANAAADATHASADLGVGLHF